MMIDVRTTIAELTAIRSRPGVVAVDDAVLRVEGPGAVACMQGILTNDIEKVALPALVHGAILTPKGMIITTLWCRRDPAGITLIVPREGTAALLEQLRRSFPPRLAKVRDVSAEHSVWWLLGGAEAPSGAEILRPSGPAPFEGLWIGPASGAPEALPHGTTVGPSWWPTALRLLDGWPALGREIDEKTLPQEVRFDELESVKYDKGCYVGQETVARLHFRGHANRTLRAVIGEGAPPTQAEVHGEDRAVGSISTLALIDDRWVGMAKLRREVEDGATVTVDGRPGTVAPFPLELQALA
ncbi:MAG TPA: hypothetical protein PLI93_10680 [Gemmatimonadales bacterium]|nr:hypothetical protein [Gemmatimonadales bacterium]